MTKKLSSIPSCGTLLQRSNIKLNNPNYQTAIFNSIYQVNQQLWNSLLPTDYFLLQTSYLRVLERSQQHMDFKYVLLYKNKRLVGVAYFQLFNISLDTALNQEHIQPTAKNPSLNEKIQASLLNSIRGWQFRLMICGTAYISGQHGWYFNKAAIQPTQAYDMLATAVEQIKESEGLAGRSIDMVMLKDYEPHNLTDARYLNELDYVELETDPVMMMPIPDHWYSFKDYLNDLTSKYRTRVKNHQKKGKRITHRQMNYKEVVQHLPQIYAMYEHLANKANFCLTVSPASYFLYLLEEMPKECIFWGAFHENELVGYVITIHKGRFMEIHYLGFDEQLNKTGKLYTNILYNVIDFAIQQNVRYLYFGRTATEIKSAIGADPIEMNSFLKYKYCLPNKIMRLFINNFTKNEWKPRHPFKENVHRTA